MNLKCVGHMWDEASLGTQQSVFIHSAQPAGVLGHAVQWDQGDRSSAMANVCAMAVCLAMPLLFLMSFLVIRPFWGDLCLWGSSFLEHCLPTYGEGDQQPHLQGVTPLPPIYR